MTMVGGGEQIETVHAPAVADICRRIFTRAHYLRDRPIAVEPQLWADAQEQLKRALELRGWPLLASNECNQPNFMLCGVPVVME